MNLDGFIIPYANVIGLLLSSHSWETVQSKAEVRVNKIYNKLNGNKLSLSINKSVFIAFTIRNIFFTPINEIKIHL